MINMNPDRENLLTNAEREHGSSNYPVRCSNFLTSKSIRKNLLLLVLSIFIASSLTVYFYLNLVAINGNQSEQAIYKPLSRRKPILDHESIFLDSGPSLIRLSDLLAHCIVALQIAGREVVKLSLVHNDQLNHVGSKGKTLEGVDDVVTGVDMKSHQIIVNTIKDSYRRLSVISEEDTTTAFEGLHLEDDILPIKRTEFARMLRVNLQDIEEHHEDRSQLIAQHETLVWIDPLDATKEYSENLTEYVTLMACIVHKSVPIAGVIFKPFSNETYWSVRDGKIGAAKHSPDLVKLLNAKARLNHDNTDKIAVIVSRSHAGDVKSVLDDIYGDRITIKTAGGSGFKTLELLGGRVDGYVHITHIKKWDICAPHAILNSIDGGNLTNLGGEKIRFGDPKIKGESHGLIATLNKTTHHGLVKSLRSLIVNR